MTRPFSFRRSAAGFTLLEAIVVMVITGILAGMVAVFIKSPIEGYADTVRRAELTDAADVALRRITRDIRLALPNSLRVTVNGGIVYIEFIMTQSGGRYRSEDDAAGNALSFTDPAAKKVDVFGAPAAAVGDYLVVYNLGPGNAPGDAYNFDATANGNNGACRTGGCNVARVAAINGSVVTLVDTTSTANNPFAGQSPPLPSPNHRFQIVPGNVKAVTYACPQASGNLQRYQNYGFRPAQPTSGFNVTPALLVANASCQIDYAANATGRNGLLSIALTLRSPASGESVTLYQQIHVDNSP